MSDPRICPRCGEFMDDLTVCPKCNWKRGYNEIVERIKKMIKQEEAIPVRDGAEIITPEGIDAKVRRDTLYAVLREVTCDGPGN